LGGASARTSPDSHREPASGRTTVPCVRSDSTRTGRTCSDGPVSPTTRYEGHQMPELLTVSQVCRRLPGARGANNATPSTVSRWILAGCPSRSGERVKLNATRAGSRWLVDTADLDKFFAALKGEIDQPPAPTPTSSAADAARRAKAAVKNLISRGA